jgi:hypothetical protein
MSDDVVVSLRRSHQGGAVLKRRFGNQAVKAVPSAPPYLGRI